MFVLAHFSDPHLGPLPTPRLTELAGKRLLGFLNWRRRRRAHHRADVLNALVRDVKAAAPDHIAVTGDLVNIALAGEFTPARLWLDRLGAPEQVTVVPGNHDAYVRAARPQPARYWGDYMRGDAGGPAGEPDGPSQFPFVRRRGPVALIGLSTAVPTAPFMATGRLGAEQISRLGETLDALAREDLFRIVLIHHPPTATPSATFKRLVDAGPFRRTIARHGAELVLHGHSHIRSLVWLEGPVRRVAAIGVPSASAAADGSSDPAGYNLYRIDRGPEGWRCEVVSHDLSGDGFIEVGRQALLA